MISISEQAPAPVAADEDPQKSPNADDWREAVSDLLRAVERDHGPISERDLRGVGIRNAIDKLEALMASPASVAAASEQTATGDGLTEAEEKEMRDAAKHPYWSWTEGQGLVKVHFLQQAIKEIDRLKAWQNERADWNYVIEQLQEQVQQLQQEQRTHIFDMNSIMATDCISLGEVADRVRDVEDAATEAHELRSEVERLRGQLKEVDQVMNDAYSLILYYESRLANKNTSTSAPIDTVARLVEVIGKVQRLLESSTTSAGAGDVGEGK